MSGLAKIDVFGPPQYGNLKGIEGIVFHTPENGDPSVEAAIATAKWQASAGNTSGGSYHGILGYDSSKGPMSDRRAWVLVKEMPFGRIAGSISTRRDDIWHPERFAVLQLLSDAAYADPNAYLHALCFGGDAAWWTGRLSTDAGRAEVRGALVRMAQWVRHLEKLYDYDAVLNQHRMWQTNRSDADGLELTDYIMDEYEKLGADDGGSTEGATPDPAVAALQAQVTQLTTDLNAEKVKTDRLRKRLDAKDAAMKEGLAA